MAKFATLLKDPFVEHIFRYLDVGEKDRLALVSKTMHKIWIEKCSLMYIFDMLNDARYYKHKLTSIKRAPEGATVAIRVSGDDLSDHKPDPSTIVVDMLRRYELGRWPVQEVMLLTVCAEKVMPIIARLVRFGIRDPKLRHFMADFEDSSVKTYGADLADMLPAMGMLESFTTTSYFGTKGGGHRGIEGILQELVLGHPCPNLKLLVLGVYNEYHVEDFEVDWLCTALERRIAAGTRNPLKIFFVFDGQMYDESEYMQESMHTWNERGAKSNVEVSVVVAPRGFRWFLNMLHSDAKTAGEHVRMRHRMYTAGFVEFAKVLEEIYPRHPPGSRMCNFFN